MSDEGIHSSIEQLVAEEHELRREADFDPGSAEERPRDVVEGHWQ